MSLVFNDTTNYNGLVQQYEKEIGAQPGDISSDTTKLKRLTVDINSALDDFTALAIRSSGTWQWDDSNHKQPDGITGNYPIITTNLVAGQRDYTFTADGSGNLILDIYKVAILPSATATQYIEIDPVDAQGGDMVEYFSQTVTGTPYRYDKTANGIFLDPIPGYSVANGLLLYINREASHFAYTDTDKKPGIPGIFHKYLWIKAAYGYAARNSMEIAGGRLRNGAFTGLAMQVNDLEKQIEEYFGRREKDVRRQITTKGISFR